MLKGTGALPSPIDIRDYRMRKVDVEYPDEYFIGGIPIKNQGGSPTCVAHALSEIVEFHTLKDIQEFNQFSTEFIYGCRNNDEYSTEGMYLRDGLRIVKNYGDVLYQDLKGNSSTAQKASYRVNEKFEELKSKAYPYRITAYYKIKTIQELKQSIYCYGPVLASMKWQTDNFKNGTYQYDPTEDHGNHAVIVVGWDRNNLIIQNSWGLHWQLKGYFKVPINIVDEVFREFYGITDDIENTVKPMPSWSWLTKLINMILRFLNRY